MTGVILPCAHKSIPVVVDGIVVAASTLVAYRGESRGPLPCIRRTPVAGHARIRQVAARCEVGAQVGRF